MGKLVVDYLFRLQREVTYLIIVNKVITWEVLEWLDNISMFTNLRYAVKYRSYCKYIFVKVIRTRKY